MQRRKSACKRSCTVRGMRPPQGPACVRLRLGIFAKIIEKYVVQEKLLTLEEAIRKMTSFSANVLGIYDRGTLEVGMKADINIFEPNNVRALATYPNPFVLAEGFDIVLVNGKKAWQDQNQSQQLWGRVLRPENIR